MSTAKPYSWAIALLDSSYQVEGILKVAEPWCVWGGGGGVQGKYRIVTETREQVVSLLPPF